ncbi:hypothetical protein CMV_016634 [Castanea mollissima]|uniref:Uncharacterized protein n=1 Tax=Castanea mollissima TaxID=60419 RepID=A0A8J4QTJ8_9ROSI|nr:hypothetical protein CMV_016634 [Castanea mollissima]
MPKSDLTPPSDSVRHLGNLQEELLHQTERPRFITFFTGYDTGVLQEELLDQIDRWTNSKVKRYNTGILQEELLHQTKSVGKLQLISINRGSVV